MSSALEKKYYSCQDCKINSVSNHDKTIQVVPEGLNMLAPSEQVSVDFCSYLKQDIMMLKDRVSGIIWARATHNQTAQEAFNAIMEWSFRMGMPHEVRSDVHTFAF